MFCVECGIYTKNNKSTVLCGHCNKKIDKYMTTNFTYKLIDCLLLNTKIFYHFLLNTPVTFKRFIKFLLLQMFCLFFVKTDEFCFKTNLKIEIFYYVIICGCLYRYICIPRVFFSILFSSFFNYFKILIYLWNYEKIQYYYIADFLNCCSNIVAMRIYNVNKKYLVFIIIGTRLACWRIFNPEVFNNLRF